VRDSGATGVFAFNDMVAIGVVDSLRSSGVDVPGQVSVIGVDDIPQAELIRLTTVATPTDDAGRTAVDMLLQRARLGRAGRSGQGPDGSSDLTNQLLPTSLVIRQSTGPAPHTAPVPKPSPASDRAKLARKTSGNARAAAHN
jgi:LacI family transcriptional regulator